MNIEYKINTELSINSIIEVYNSSGLLRPTNNLKRIKTMFKNSNLVVSAWDKKKLVGIARALTDYSYCCYLSDIAVSKNYQNKGIGSMLINIVKSEIGTKSNLVLISAPNAIDYYPKLGFLNLNNGYIIKRQE